MQTLITEADLSMTPSAQAKLAELFQEVDEAIQGVRVYAAAGGCSGVSFGMTFTDAVNPNDGIRDFDGYKLVVDDGTLEHIRGVEIDFVDPGDGNATFVFNNLPSAAGGCGTCGSAGGSCG
ncbi:MAG: HesB/IscA family protein [Halochromatium sp.]|uniref:HesB/IscA family protein n=1 Tax=Halochromatium sp. TaxID=2049430 RepID=UPI00397ACA3E